MTLVEGAPADDHDVIAGDLLDELEDLSGHHLAKSRRDPLLGNALVRRMGAVALAEDAAAARHLVGFFRSCQLRPLPPARYPIRLICWRKNSPVPEAHLFPAWTDEMRPSIPRR